MPVLYTLIFRPTYSYMPVLYTLICRPTYSYMPVLYTLICRSYILLYAGPTYSYMPVLYILLCRSYILVMVLNRYLSNGAVVSDQSNFKIFSPCSIMYFPCTCMGSNLECPIHKNFIKFCTGLLMYRLGSIKFTVSEQINFHFQICMPCSGGHLGYPVDQHICTKLNAKNPNLY